VLKRDSFKFVLFIILLAVAILAAKYFGLYDLLSLEEARLMVDGYGANGPLVFILIYGVLTILLVPGTPLIIVSGVLFGSWFGALYSLIGATIGALFAFFVSRYLGESFVERVLKNKYKKIYEWDERIEKEGFPIVFFLRVIPIFPFTIFNYALGLTRVRSWPYLVGTFLGLIPISSKNFKEPCSLPVTLGI